MHKKSCGRMVSTIQYRKGLIEPALAQAVRIKHPTTRFTSGVNTRHKKKLDATFIFSVSGGLGWHRITATRVGYRLQSGVAGVLLGKKGNGGFSSCYRRPRGPSRHFAGNRISNAFRQLPDGVRFRSHLAVISLPAQDLFDRLLPALFGRTMSIARPTNTIEVERTRLRVVAEKHPNGEC